MKTKYQWIMIILQAIFSLNRNTLQKRENSYIFNMNLIRINAIPLCIAPLLTFRNILSAFVQCWTSVILRLPISHDKRRKVKVYKIIFFYFFINPMRTLMDTALKALKKTVQMYEIMSNFCTVLIRKNSTKLEGNLRKCIVNWHAEFMNTATVVYQIAQ